mgnify:FL=1
MRIVNASIKATEGTFTLGNSQPFRNFGRAARSGCAYFAGSTVISATWTQPVCRTSRKGVKRK